MILYIEFRSINLYGNQNKLIRTLWNYYSIQLNSKTWLNFLDEGANDNRKLKTDTNTRSRNLKSNKIQVNYVQQEIAL